MAGGPCDPQRAVGLFEIQRAADYTAVSGEVAAAVPPTRRRTVVAEDGACLVLRRDNAFCDPPCASEMVCVREGQCLPLPGNVNVGTVSVHGLAQPVRTRQVAGSTQLPSGCVGLHVISKATRALTVLGHTPCKRDADCPAGSSCDLRAETCR